MAEEKKPWEEFLSGDIFEKLKGKRKEPGGGKGKDADKQARDRRILTIIGIVVGIVALLMLAAFLLSSFYTDYLWFKEVGQTGVFWKVITTKIWVFFLFGAIFFAIFYTNLYLARRVDRVFCQWDVTLRHMPRADVCRVVGSPVRAGLDRLDKRQCRRELGLDESRPMLLVTGASLGARTINEAAPAALARIGSHLRDRWQVLHQTGGATYDGAAGRRPDKDAAFECRTVDFIDRMDHAIAAADLVVCRAGASTLAELTAIGRPAILMPYPFHRDQHQRHNGQVLADAGAAVMIQDRRDRDANAAALAGPLLELMNDAAKREAMGDAARRIGRPAAADAVVDELLRMV